MRLIEISLSKQTLSVWQDSALVSSYSVSTALKGAGEEFGSEQTPRGRHIIRAKIGEGAALGTVFRGRRPTGEVWTPSLSLEHPGRDWILTRILWLSGSEVGKNRLGRFDTMRRFIYIHGTPDTEPMGVPLSHGCIRMRNQDIVDLFNQVPLYTPINISE